MKKEDFFEVLGELDDDIVKGAQTPMKKHVTWKVLGALAACLALICTIAVHFTPSTSSDNEITEEAGDAAPMVYVNDTLYIQSSDQSGYPELKDDFVYLGKIERTDCEDGTPKENFQSNLPIAGCEVYQYGENIVVHIHDAYWLYTKYGETEVNRDDLTEQEE